MTFLTLLALIMLTLVGYSSGAALAQRARHPQPLLLDLALLPLLWFMAVAFRNVLGHWASIGVWFLAGLLVSVAIGRRRPSGDPGGRLAPLPPHGNPLRGVWERWKRFSLELGQFQGRILMAFFYFLVVTPFGLGMRFFSDPLDQRRSAARTGWKARETMEDSLDHARKQS